MVLLCNAGLPRIRCVAYADCLSLPMVWIIGIMPHHASFLLYSVRMFYMFMCAGYMCGDRRILFACGWLYVWSQEDLVHMWVVVCVETGDRRSCFITYCLVLFEPGFLIEPGTYFCTFCASYLHRGHDSFLCIVLILVNVLWSKHLLLYLNFFYIYLCVCAQCAYMAWHVCGGERTSWGNSLPPSCGSQGQTQLLRWVGGAFIHWASGWPVSVLSYSKISIGFWFLFLNIILTS